MKKINFILMILAAAAGFTNCAKTDLVENKETEKGGTVVYATTDAATKTTLADDYKVLWSTGDQIKFVKEDATTTIHTFALESGVGTTSGTFKCDDTPVDGSYTVYYPASYDGTNWPAQTYAGATDISGAPMKATATVNGGVVSDISFKNEGGILRYTVKGTKSIKSINVKSGSTLDVTLGCGDGVALTVEGTVFNIALPAGEYSNATLAFTATDNTVATKTASIFIVKKNVVSLATFDALDFKAVVTLPGEFSVGESGTVKFSRGNLFWDGDSYEFEANQYTIGTWNAENHVNYFFWSKEESVAKAESYSDASAAASDVFFTNATAETAKADFTVSGVTGKFRTLSAEEWTYILSNRENAADLLAEDVTVCGVEHCLVIAPDACLNSYEFDKTKKSYDAAAWATAEAAGLVCLPPAGFRDGATVKSDDGNGFYWSSTTGNAESASNLGFK